ncbi:MAG: DNA-binding transcriptional regulator, partial [Planctomycetia bacterium]|nr:DNA-binding transcriptional regulator [Planctomycetia bacterium]
MPRRTTIYLLLEMSRQFTREIFHGMIRWSNIYGPVSFVAATGGDLCQSLPQLGSRENIGLIARLPTPGVVEAVQKIKIPLITIEPSVEEYVQIKQQLQISEIVSNSPAIAQLGFDHFRARGFRQFGFCGLPHRIWSSNRQEAFIKCAEDADCPCSVYPIPKDAENLSPEKERPHLAAWLQSLPKPIAILCCNDDRGAQLIQVCQEYDILVPDEVAVLGVDNDELLCELSTPKLSSVKLDLENVGFEAMDLLWKMISGTKSGYHRIPLEPLRITTRNSTDVVSLEDDIVNRAIRFIRNSYQMPIGVSDVARELDISRRTLERHFFEVLHSSVWEQIQTFRLEQARHLLEETGETVERIAILSGFQNIKPMLRFFYQREGITPSEYRQKKNEKALSPEVLQKKTKRRKAKKEQKILKEQ